MNCAEIVGEKFGKSCVDERLAVERCGGVRRRQLMFDWSCILVC